MPKCKITNNHKQILYDEAVELLDVSARLENGVKAFCPAHDDVNNPSLTCYRDKHGFAVLKCYTGCTTTEIVEALGLEPTKVKKKVEPPKKPRSFHPAGYRHPHWVATYNYLDSEGVVRYRIVRDKDKNFMHQEAAIKDDVPGFYSGYDGTRYPYRLPEWVNEKWIAIVEGERDADNLWKHGIPATTNSGGSSGLNKYISDHKQWFKDKDVIIIPDCDEPGHKLKDVWVENLKNVVKSIGWVKLPYDVTPKHGKDISDWISEQNNFKQEFEKLLEPPFLQEIVKGFGTHRITVDANIDEGKPVLRVVTDNINSVIARKFNITTIVGLQGFGKSTILSGAVVAAVIYSRENTQTEADTLGFIAENIENNVLLIDTEQSNDDIQRLHRQAVYKRIKTDHTPDYIDIFGVRRLKPDEIVSKLREQLKLKAYDLILIDHIADCVNNINDVVEVDEFIKLLFDICDNNVAIVCNIHPNPGMNNRKAQGRLGSQLLRKSRTVFTTLKSPPKGPGDFPSYMLTTEYGSEGKNSADGPATIYYQWDRDKKMFVTYEPTDEDDFSSDGKPKKIKLSI